MFSSILCVSCLIAAAISSALFPRDDGFTFEFDGARHLGYGVIPHIHGESVTLAFHDVDFMSNGCSNVKVEVFRNGYVKMDQYLASTICDAQALQDFSMSSVNGFYIQVTTSKDTQHGQIKASFNATSGTKVVLSSFQR